MLKGIDPLLTPELLNILGVLRERLLLPAEGDGFEQGEQRHRCGRNHALAGGQVEHTFTHFHLILRVMVARIDGPVTRGDWTPHLRPSDLPTVMRKAWDLAHPALAPTPTPRDAMDS